MNPELVEILEKLAAAGIQIVPSEITSHFILERDGFVAFVERREQAFGNAGAPGLMTEQGFAALIWRGDRSFFVGKGFEQAGVARTSAKDPGVRRGFDERPALISGSVWDHLLADVFL